MLIKYCTNQDKYLHRIILMHQKHSRALNYLLSDMCILFLPWGDGF